MTPEAAAAAPKVLVVAYCLPPHASIGAHRPLRLLQYLTGRGWNVSVLTAKPEAYLSGTPVDPQLLERMPAPARVVRTGALRGFSVLGRLLAPLKRIVRGTTGAPAAAGIAASVSADGATGAAAGTPARRPGLKKLVEEMAAMPDKDVGWVAPAILHGLRRFAGTRPDVIYSTAPPWSGHLVAGTLATAWKCPWVADFRDPWVRSPWTRYATPLAHGVGARLERLVIRRADAVLFTTDTARMEFAHHYGEALAAKFHTVPNGCDAGEFAAAPPGAANGADPDAPFVLLHAGSLYGGRSPLPLLKAMARLVAENPAARSRLRVRFLGASSMPGGDADQVCRELGIQGMVEFLGRVSRRESLAEMQRAGALLILQAGLTLAIPGKLYQYFAAGRPVLALCEEGEMAETIRAHRVGLVAGPNDEPAIAAALRRLMTPGAVVFLPAAPALFDGRLRAAETTAILESTLALRAESPAPAGNTSPVRRA